MARWPQPSDGACEVVQSQIDGISLVTIQLVHMVSAAQLPSSASVPTLLRYHREGGGKGGEPFALMNYSLTASS